MRTKRDGQSSRSAGRRDQEDRPPLFSVIIPCLGHAEELRDCLQGLIEQEVDFPFEIIVVDSAADLDVAAVVAEFSVADLVRDVEKGIMSSGVARNLGSAHAQGRHLAFTDADCVPEPSWLAAARESLEAGARLTGGPVLDQKPWHPIASIDNVLQFADFPANRPDEPARYFPGCNLALSRRNFHSIGGFPKTAEGRAEDALFCTMARNRWPGEMYYKQKMRVRHRGRLRLDVMWRHQWSFGYNRASLRIQLKPIYRLLGRYAVLVPLVMVKRLSYIVTITIRWNPIGLVRLAVLFPVLLVGLLAWAIGFHKGSNTASELARQNPLEKEQ